MQYLVLQVLILRLCCGLELQVLFFGAPRAARQNFFWHANAPPIKDLRGVLWDCHTVPTALNGGRMRTSTVLHYRLKPIQLKCWKDSYVFPSPETVARRFDPIFTTPAHAGHMSQESRASRREGPPETPKLRKQELVRA